MNIVFEQAGNRALVTIEGDPGIEHAAELKQKLQEAVACADSVMVQLHAVGDIHPACMQLICSAHKTAEAEKKTIQCCDMPEELTEAAAASGFLRSVPCMHKTENRCMWMRKDRL